jgi:hypothetical protein
VQFCSQLYLVAEGRDARKRAAEEYKYKETLGNSVKCRALDGGAVCDFYRGVTEARRKLQISVVRMG